MLHIGTFRWGQKYPVSYVEKLARGVARNLKQDYRFVVFHPTEEDMHLTEIPGCFCRLRAFDPEWQRLHGIRPGDRLVCLDLDLIVTGPLDALFDRHENFVILQGANSSNPCPMNGSVWMIRGGEHADVWADFSLEAASKIRKHSFADDQGWLWHKFGDNFAGWDCGEASGIWAFQKPGWPGGVALPPHARVVAFPGHRDPSQFAHLDWVKRHWA